MSRGNKFTLTVRNSVGEDIWGPQQLAGHGALAFLRSQGAPALECPSVAVTLMDGARVLDFHSTIEDSGVADGAVLTAVVCPTRLEAASICAEMSDLEGECEMNDAEDWQRFLAMLRDFRQGYPNLPEEVRAWLDVWFNAGYCPHDQEDSDFALSDLKMFGGLLPISHHEAGLGEEILVFVDCEGGFGRELYGHAGDAKGAVWFAHHDYDGWYNDTYHEDWEWPSPAFWKRLQEDSKKPRSASTVITAPIMVAENLTDFFKQWVEQGQTPIAAFVNGTIRRDR